jgi:radical SAM protein with 4Fe4S-binding SPASM domain
MILLLCNVDPNSIFEECINEQLICRQEDIYKIYGYKWVDIETTTICNYACTYCPVAYFRRDPSVMDIDLFANIISQLEMIDTVEYITLNSYNEPTIDPYFTQRMELLCSSRLKLHLYTNGSKLTDKQIQLLIKKRDVQVFINIPGLDADYYYKITGGGDIEPVLINIEKCLENDLDVQFVVNGFGRDATYHAEQLKNRYKDRIKRPTLPNFMTDRCGNLPNAGKQNIYINGDLVGCNKVLNTLSIAADGTVFLCCNDYFHKTTLGNLKTESLKNIVDGKEAISQRGYIYGEPGAASDHICRYCIYMKLSKKIEKKRYAYAF